MLKQVREANLMGSGLKLQITIERDSARIADRQLLQVLRTCASHGLSRHSLQKLSGVFIYAPALAQVAERYVGMRKV